MESKNIAKVGMKFRMLLAVINLAFDKECVWVVRCIDKTNPTFVHAVVSPLFAEYGSGSILLPIHYFDEYYNGVYWTIEADDDQ